MTLVDAQARGRIRSDLDVDLFVEAGAGSGKTTELVHRIVALVRDGHARIGEIVAITFTEAAASECKQRCRHALEEAMARSASREQTSRLRAALVGLDEAPLQTIHAFAQRLLQAHASEAGLPPVFCVADRVQTRLDFEREWRIFLTQTFSSPHALDPELEDVLRIAIALGLNTRQLRSLATQVHDQWHLLSGFDSVLESVGKIDSTVEVQAVDSLDVCVLIEHLDRVSKLAIHCLSDDDRMFRRLVSGVEPWHQRIVESKKSNDLAGLIEVIRQAPSLSSGNIGKKSNWPNGILDSVRSSLRAIADERNAVLHGPRQHILSSLLSQVIAFTRRSAAERRAVGRLEFTDLLVLVRDLLRDQPAIRQVICKRYRHVLVDEFQDTDPLQVEIVDLLTGTGVSIEHSFGNVGDTSNVADKSDVGNVSGVRRFTVGDPKQSIYRFRNADLDQYEVVRSRSNDVVLLNTNFRTLPALVDWVNATFAKLLADAPIEWQQLAAGRTAVAGGGHGSITLTGIEHPSATGIATVRATEAQDVAGALRQAYRERWAIQDGTAVRPIRYSDMAVLLPTRAVLPALERSLRQSDLPYRVESRSLIWATQELRDLVSILSAIDDPCDQLSLVAALRCAAFGCGDDDLLDWKCLGQSWDYRQAPPGNLSGHPVAEAFVAFGRLHEQRWWCPVPELISLVVQERSLYQLAFGLGRQRESWNRLRFFNAQVRSWWAEGGTTLRGFVDWARVQMQEGADAVESVIPDEDDDAVRIMTIHAAKGLEFPAVFLAGLGGVSTVHEPTRLLWNDEGQPQVRIGPKTAAWETRGFADAEAREVQKAYDEDVRLLYVAATRARDHLFVSLHRKQRSCLAVRLSDVCGDVSVGQVVKCEPSVSRVGSVCSVGPPGPVSPARFTDSGLHETAHFVDVDQNARQRQAIVDVASRPAALAATTIARRSSRGASSIGLIPVSTATSYDSDTAESATRLAFGRAVHQILESIDLDAPKDLDRLASIAARREAIEGRAPELIASVRLALDSKVVREAADSGRWFKEVYVAGVFGGTVVEGFVDLLYERSDGWVVVDYKTDAVSSGQSMAEAMANYRWQLVAYAGALEQSLKRRVAEAVLLFIPPTAARAIVAPVSDLESAVLGLGHQIQHLLEKPLRSTAVEF